MNKLKGLVNTHERMPNPPILRSESTLKQCSREAIRPQIMLLMVRHGGDTLWRCG
jgi:hypothetical protein